MALDRKMTYSKDSTLNSISLLIPSAIYWPNKHDKWEMSESFQAMVRIWSEFRPFWDFPESFLRLIQIH